MFTICFSRHTYVNVWSPIGKVSNDVWRIFSVNWVPLPTPSGWKKLGGILPPLYGESTTLTPGKFQRKQQKMVFLRKTRLKVDQTGPKMNQKRAKNRLKLAEVSVFVSKIICLFFHENWVASPSPPLRKMFLEDLGVPHPTLHIFNYFGHLVKKN